MAKKKAAKKKATKKKAAKKKVSVPVEAIKHASDTRKNIPTEELRDFVPDEPAETMLYPRDQSLDPQLVWKGKDEQDREPLEVPVVPVYIQEKIHPQAIIEDVRKRLGTPEEKPREVQPSLFGDFNGIEDFAQKVDFYQHDQHWSNRMILGDSLLVMTSLAEKEGLKGQVQMIYIDPPYGIKFRSNWQVSTRDREVKEKAEDVSRQPEQVLAFRDTWQYGINSYLSYLRDRLTVARELLTQSGSVFVQIGDANVHIVRTLLDEVFGTENFCSLISYATTTTTTGKLLPGTSDYVIWYAKDVEAVKYRPLFNVKAFGQSGATSYGRVQLADGTRRSATDAEKKGADPLPEGSRIFAVDNLTSPRVREARTGYFPVAYEGIEYLPRRGEWKTHRAGTQRLVKARRVESMTNTVRYVRFIDDFPAYPINNMWNDVGGTPDKVYVVQTTPKVIERCMMMTTDPGDLVLARPAAVRQLRSSRNSGVEGGLRSTQVEFR